MIASHCERNVFMLIAENEVKTVAFPQHVGSPCKVISNILNLFLWSSLFFLREMVRKYVLHTYFNDFVSNCDISQTNLLLYIVCKSKKCHHGIAPPTAWLLHVTQTCQQWRHMVLTVFLMVNCLGHIAGKNRTWLYAFSSLKERLSKWVLFMRHRQIIRY